MIGSRLAQAAFATMYGGAGPALGPVLAGCTVVPAAKQLILDFNVTLLRNSTIVWSPNASTSAENTALYALTGAALPADVGDNHHAGSGSYGGAFFLIAL